jgi:hypothetical protein
MATTTARLTAGAMLAALAGGAHAQTFTEALAAGKPILEIRPRFESVDQANLARDAEAFTVRTRLGWETGSWNDLKGLIEFEDVRQLGGERYNSGINGKTLYPVIADPEVTELNRLQATWTHSKTFSATLGRQRILLDDQRFVGAVAWRQDEQTFDAVRADATLGKVKVTAAYVAHVNRISAEAADWDSESWLVNAAMPVSTAFTPQAFVYALDFDNAPGSSSLTWGLRATGRWTAGDLVFAYAASFARQSDYGNNPASFDLDYRQAELSVTRGIVTAKAAYESLEGNGARGFSTPLATAHAFQGWADVFLTTPADGIEDANLTLTLKPKLGDRPLELTARYHSFEAERTGADLGEELDLLASAAVTKRLTALVKYADYDGVPGFPSRRKVWVGFEFKL